MQIKALKSALNRYLDVGHKMVTKMEISRASDEDLALAEMNLTEWQSSGYLNLRTVLFSANDDDVCVELIGYIDNEKPWSDPLSGKM